MYTFHILHPTFIFQTLQTFHAATVVCRCLMTWQPQRPGVWPNRSASRWLGSIALSINASRVPWIRSARLSITDWLLFMRKSTFMHRWWLISHVELSAYDVFQWKEKKICFTSSLNYWNVFVSVYGVSQCTHRWGIKSTCELIKLNEVQLLLTVKTIPCSSSSCHR